MLLDVNNYKSGDTGYQPGQRFRNSYKDNPLNDDDSYASINPNYNIELDDDDAYPSVNPPPSSQFEDSGYESVNKNNNREEIKQLAKERANKSSGNRKESDNKSANNKSSETDSNQNSRSLSTPGGMSQSRSSPGAENGANNSIPEGIAKLANLKNGLGRADNSGNRKKDNASTKNNRTDDTSKPEAGGLLDDVRKIAGQNGESRDPRKAAVDVVDKYLHLGKKLVLLTWAIWYIIGVFCFLLSITIVGIPVLLIVMVILNIFIISPKTVYRITELILDLVGVGEYLQAMDEIGLGKVEMKATGWQKASIIGLDFLVVIGIIVLIVVITRTACEYFGLIPDGFFSKITSSVTSTVINVATNSDAGSVTQEICKSVGGIFK